MARAGDDCHVGFKESVQDNGNEKSRTRQGSAPRVTPVVSAQVREPFAGEASGFSCKMALWFSEVWTLRKALAGSLSPRLGSTRT